MSGLQSLLVDPSLNAANGSLLSDSSPDVPGPVALASPSFHPAVPSLCSTVDAAVPSTCPRLALSGSTVDAAVPLSCPSPALSGSTVDAAAALKADARHEDSVMLSDTAVSCGVRVLMEVVESEDNSGAVLRKATAVST